ncbi:hypothetical protein pb186bvf_012367 [Paramecium bursaria]
MIEQDEAKRLEEKVQHLQQTLEISKAQYNLENSVLREQIKKLSAGKDVTEISEQNIQLQQESASIKESLLKYWVSVTKTLNDDFEEILQLGIDTNIVDIVNALLMVEDARQEQIKSDKDTINELREINQNLQHRVDQFDQKPQVQSEEPTAHEQENKDLAKQLRDLSHLMIEQNRNLELKDFKIQELQQQIQNLTPEIRNLEIQINELTLKLVQVKEEKLQCMQQAQEQNQSMKERELELQRQLQYYQMKYSRHDDTPENKKGSRNSMDGMNFQQHHEEERQSSLNRVQQQNGSPFLSKFKPIPTGQQAELSRSVLMNKKMELVQGSSQPQQPYRFGK